MGRGHQEQTTRHHDRHSDLAVHRRTVTGRWGAAAALTSETIRLRLGFEGRVSARPGIAVGSGEHWDPG